MLATALKSFLTVRLDLILTLSRDRKKNFIAYRSSSTEGTTGTRNISFGLHAGPD